MASHWNGSTTARRGERGPWSDSGAGCARPDQDRRPGRTGGRLDAVVVDNRLLELLRGDGRGGFTHAGALADGDDLTRFVDAADVTGDGRADVLAVGSDGVSVLSADRTGRLQLTSHTAVPV